MEYTTIKNIKYIYTYMDMYKYDIVQWENEALGSL